MRRQVDIARHAAQLHPQLLAEVDERLQLARVSRQPVEVPDEHAADRPSAQVVQHPLVLRPRFAAPGADVVVDVTAADHEPAPIGQPPAILDLAPDPELIPVAVRRDPRVDPDAHPNR